MARPHIPSVPDAGHLAALVDSSDDAIISKDRDAIIRTWNPGAERLYGWSADEAIGRPISILIPDRLRGEERRILNRILAGERVEHYETERVRKDGSSVWVSLTISPVRDEHGTIVAASVIARDVTERRQIEAERRRLLAETQAANAAVELSRRRLALLAQASALLSKSLDVEPLLQQLAELVVPEFAERCVIDLLDEGVLRRVASAPADGGPVSETLQRLIADVAETGEQSEGNDESVPAGAGVPEIAIPIARSGTLLGVLACCAAAPAQRYGLDDVSLLEELARRAALALENARAFRAEHEVAVTLQRSLLPRRLHDVPGFSFAARYLPAASTLNVGGDWYDVIPTRDGSVVGVIGDVAGRGALAASIMGQLRNALRAYAFDGQSPAACAERVNHLMRSFESQDMATLAVVAHSAAHDELTLLRAGHLPPLVRELDGSVRRLEGHPCVPLGVTAHPVYRESRETIAPGSTIVLFTDGLVERRGESIDVGLDRLAAALAEGPAELEQLADYLAERLLGPEDDRGDDVALLLLRRLEVDTTRFAFRHAADPDALAPLRRELRHWLEATGADRQTRHDVVTACSEAAANIVEHAYPGTPHDIEVEARRDGDALELSIRDRGRWRPQRDTGGGRGLKLMRILMEDVEIDTGEDGTTVTMRRRLRQEAAR